MNSTLSKVLKFLLGGILLVGVLLSGFYFKAVGNLSPEATFNQQKEALGSLLDSYIYYAYILTIATTLLTLVFAVVKMVIDPKSAIKSLITIVILGIIVAIGWSVASDTVLSIPGYTGGDNVPSTLRWSGTILWTTYIASAISIVVLIYAEVSKTFK